MAALDWLAGIVLFFELPVPVFWLIFHLLAATVRPRPRTTYLAAAVTAWTAGGALLFGLREHLFASRAAPAWTIILGLVLIAADAYLFIRAERELGTRRIIGQAELAGEQRLAAGGIYARVRHPRYLGMMLAVTGACLLAATLLLWVLVLAWFGLVAILLRLEEWELLRRLGAAYADYRRRVPGLLPFRLFPRAD